MVQSVDIEIVIAGDGPERKRLQEKAESRQLTNIKFMGSLPRDEYRQLALTCDVGVAITVEGVSPPTFPSKIVEYCRLQLPVLVCTEASSDAGEIVAENGAGLSISAGDPELLAAALMTLREKKQAGELEGMAEQAGSLYQSKFSVERVVESLEKL
ncbi:hypothetical protein KbCgl_03110 [Corynebacterium glutamicum]|nr:hypothetical protein KbCgl_03110 [Corynebacterium glutamicum]